MLQKGEQFPIFKLENQDGTVITNDTLKGKKAIVYFYPRDNTPTCTTEACDFRDNLEMFNDLDVAVYGISGDSKKKHQNFIEKHGLNFDLLVDEDFKLAKETGVYQLKKIIWQRKYGHCKNDFYNR
uniref:thioredoxin-dependent peroxiredoxin n=1 Tax=Staphylococcus schleiferi TaxID=1295 RepID=A0A7Z7R0H1_STASC|nr:Thiol peroxidase, Bcp-type [Staphylococcus schleiferi]